MGGGAATEIGRGAPRDAGRGGRAGVGLEGAELLDGVSMASRPHQVTP